MSLIVEQIKPEHSELFALEFGKIAESDFVYTLASTNINQSAQNLVKMYMIMRFRVSLIMDLIAPELSEFFDPEFAKGSHVSSVYMGILGQLFYPFLPILPSFFFLNKNQDHFSNSLKNLKHSYIIRLIK